VTRGLEDITAHWTRTLSGHMLRGRQTYWIIRNYLLLVRQRNRARREHQMREPPDPPDDDLELTGGEDPVAMAISALAGRFVDRPGFMWTQSGFEVVHAKWPAYPVGHGRRAALYTLAEYPPGTKFFDVDNIDGCTLFSVGSQRRPAGSGLEHLFVAVWDEDLRELAKAGLIEGVTDLEEDFLRYPQKYIEPTPKAAHLALIYELTAGIHPEILDRVDEFLEINRCDAAVREASILLERAIRALVGNTKANANQLIEQMFEQVSSMLPMPRARKLQLKAEFLRFFAYVRNDFAHKIRDVDVVAASRILRRCSRLLQVVEALRPHDSAA
jgi:uncharacterized protein Ymh